MSATKTTALLFLTVAIAAGSLASTATAGGHRPPPPPPSYPPPPPPPPSECPCRRDLFGLGRTSQFGILVLGGRFEMSGGSRLEGDVGLAAGTSGNQSGGSIVKGTMFLDSSARLTVSGGSSSTGGTQIDDLSGPVANAFFASSTFSGWSPTRRSGTSITRTT